MKNKSYFLQNLSSAGVTMIFIIIALLISSIAAGTRFWNLGDISLGKKIIESSGLLIIFFILLSISFHFFEAFILGSKRFDFSIPRSYNETSVNVSTDDLMHFESELPEEKQPEIEGIKSKVPEELAGVLKGLSDKNE